LDIEEEQSLIEGFSHGIVCGYLQNSCVRV